MIHEAVFTWNVDPVLFDGPIALRYYGLIFALTLVGGYYLWQWQMRSGGYPDKVAQPFMAYGTIAIIIGARLGHCLFYDFARCFNPLTNVLKIWQGGLSSHGATIGLIAALWLFARLNQIHFVEVLDRFSFSATLGAIMVRVGNFINSEIVGRVTDGSWGVRFPRYDRQLAPDEVPPRHPSQLYEVGLGLLVMAVLYVLYRRHGEQRPRGLLGAAFMTTYFAGRFVVEFFKEYQTLTGGLTMGQWLSLPAFLVGLAWLVRVLTRGEPTSGAPRQEPAPSSRSRSRGRSRPRSRRSRRKR